MPLPKSYSDRVGLAKGRQPWRRSVSHPANLQTPRPGALQPISEVTKNKLSRFRYQPDPGHAAGDTSVSFPSKNIFGTSLPSAAGQAQEQTTAPVTCLAWQDLMDPNVPVDEAANASPNDKVLWSNEQDPASLQALSPMLARKRKRARSSSPMSSPLAERTTTPTVDVENLKKALRAGRADPTLELWDRYSLNYSNKTKQVTVADRIVSPSLARIATSSSPKPDKTDRHTPPGRAGSLRKSVGRGFDSSKRTKVTKFRSSAQASYNQRELEAASKSSLVDALLDTVTNTLGHDFRHDSGRYNRVLCSPTKSRKLSGKSSPRAAGGKTPTADSSDYGDDDFDEEAIMELEATLNSISNTETLSTDTKHSAEKTALGVTSNETTGTSDDYDELDDDLVDEVENLLNHAHPAPRGKPTTSSTPHDAKPAPVDEFGDLSDGDFDFDALESGPQPGSPSAATTKQRARKIQRYLVTSVLEGEYVDQHGNARPEKILIIQSDGSKDTRTLHLRGSWYDTPAKAQSYVHVIGKFSVKGQCIIDDAQNLVILHPDQLISATVVADSFGCMRRAVLQDRVKATSGATPPLVYGTMLHEIFQEALLANQWDRSFLSQVINGILEKHVEDLYTIKMSPAAAREHLESKMMELSCWAKTFVSSQAQADAIVQDRHGKTATMAITKLLDVEEHVWSPMYGLKGNIDATVEVSMVDGQTKRTLTVPLEVKTGKHANNSHMAQTALYALLLSDRYDVDVAYGILYYMETSKTMRIPSVRQELRHMILQRNQLACYIRERSVQLPPMIKSKHMCSKCYAKTSCFVYHRLADDGDGESSGLGDDFEAQVKHLTPEHRQFFVKWEDLLTKEEKESRKMKRELWTMTSAEREKKSRCFSDVVIENGSVSVDQSSPRINRFHYTLVKRIHPPGFSFLESELSVGEPIVVSDEEGHFALAIGYVTSVRKRRISVAVDRRLHNTRIRQPGFDEVDNQVFAGIMEVRPEGGEAGQSQEPLKETATRYRLDQDEFSNGMATVRNNLVQMMANESPMAERLRRLIVDLEPPSYKTMATQYTTGAGMDELNVDQQKAIEKVMMAQDYALVLGMPGTGKTTTIAHIIRALIGQGKSVLLTSHTHTAVDNILLKLKLDAIPIFRLGALAKVHPEVREFVQLAGISKKSAEEIREAWHVCPVVATTCLGINHGVFQERSFDYCIVDEASQITLPICAGPIRMARAFVLVGDHNQLPPVVRNEEAREGGLDVSLFKLLSDAHPESVVNLEHQYRMCEDIMTLSNTLIYQGRLRCGSEALRRKRLHVPRIEALSEVHHDASSVARQSTPRSICTGPARSRCWLYDLLDGESRVRFINTDTLRPVVHEEAQGKRIVNRAEVTIVWQLVESLLRAGVPASEVGVMTHYRAQLFLLRERLRGQEGLEMHTTDRFQGRDKEVVVVSLVRSNEGCNMGDLLKDWRRINVAFTRAKTKLLVVGSMKTLKHGGQENMLGRFIGLMEEREWIYDLPAEALDNHHFADTSTPSTAVDKAASPKRSPRKIVSPKADGEDKENQGQGRRQPKKRARMGERVLLRGRPNLKGILDEMMNGA